VVEIEVFIEGSDGKMADGVRSFGGIEMKKPPQNVGSCGAAGAPGGDFSCSCGLLVPQVFFFYFAAHFRPFRELKQTG